MIGRFDSSLRSRAHGALRLARRFAAGPAAAPGTPPALEWTRLESAEDYLRLVAQTGTEAQALDKSLAAEHPEGTFHVPGFCWVDSLPVAFEVDYLYALEEDGKPAINWRERMVCPICRLNNRQRAALHVAFEALGVRTDSRVYITEQVTSLHSWLRSRVPALVGSEFLGPELAPGHVNARGIRHEDLTALSFASGSLDAILSFDVLEHIPDFRKALVECHRALARGGTMLFSVPFLENHPQTRTRAHFDAGGTLVHDLSPIHHGDPVKPGEGVLCFHEFGWDILDHLRAAGFSDACVIAFRDPGFGYLGGIPLLFAAWKGGGLSRRSRSPRPGAPPARPPQDSVAQPFSSRSAAIFSRLLQRMRPEPDTAPGPKRFPDGHFYSPTVDFGEVARDVAHIWPSAVPAVQGIDFDDARHRELLTVDFPAHMPSYDYPEVLEESASLTEFYTRNSQFSWLDSRLLFVLLRKLKPARIIEVGSGFSSLLIADINRRFLDGRCDVTCIEPYPRPFLKSGIPGIGRLIEARVQDVPLDTFSTLAAGDILFVDSSHVSKTGSDVNRIVFDVLPALAPGVLIHFHDIFLPHDYPKDWVLQDGRSWNEQYLLRALLMYSDAFRVMFGASYAFHRFPELVRDALSLPSGKAFGGASLWIEKIR
jgi:SAM-dependent methyltransferase/predicted O-methyltransferase YrrM